MCLAWSCVRLDFRRFKLEVMEEVRATKESFRPRRVPFLGMFLEGISAG